MRFKSIPPSRKELRKYIQYFLFNYSDNDKHVGTFTSFPNNNICLSIIKGKQIVDDNRKKIFQHKPVITSYMSGLYLKPNTLAVDGTLDQICIDFSMLGYNRFFKFDSKQFILADDILTEAFGKNAPAFFEKVFEEPNFKKRCSMIEDFLIKYLHLAKDNLVDNIIRYIHSEKPTSSKSISNYFNCSEKKIYRHFNKNFDISPKEYMQLIRFRQSLWQINNNPNKSLTSIGYDCGYYDQSHFIREFTNFAAINPLALQQQLLSINDNVLIVTS